MNQIKIETTEEMDDYILEQETKEQYTIIRKFAHLEKYTLTQAKSNYEKFTYIPKYHGIPIYEYKLETEKFNYRFFGYIKNRNLFRIVCKIKKKNWRIPKSEMKTIKEQIRIDFEHNN